MGSTMIAPEGFARHGILKPKHDSKTKSSAQGEDEHGRNQAGQVLAGQQHLAAGGGEKPKVQRLIQHLAPEQVHEDPQAAEENRQAQIEVLENSRKHLPVL